MTTSNTTNSTGILIYRPQIDGLRFIAVFVVVCYHFLPGIQNPNNPLDIGVLLAFFFVLSSYLITKIILIGKRSGVERGNSKAKVGAFFLIRRTLRIFPAYYAYVFLLMLMPGVGQDIWENPGVYFLYLTNFHFFLNQDFSYLTGHLWTLAVEEQFYLVWPWLILFTPGKHLTKVLYSLIGVGVISRFILYGVYDIAGTEVTMQILTPTCLDSFALGALLALLHLRGNTSNPQLKIGFAACFLLWVGSIALGYLHFTAAISRIVVALLAMIIIEGANRGYNNMFGRFLENKVVLYLAKVSYGIYLYHIFSNYILLQIADMLVRGNHYIIEYTGLNVNNYLYIFYHPVLYFPLSFGVSVLLAAISWHFLEQPINNLKRFFRYKKREEGISLSESDSKPVPDMGEVAIIETVNIPLKENAPT